MKVLQYIQEQTVTESSAAQAQDELRTSTERAQLTKKYAIIYHSQLNN